MSASRIVNDKDRQELLAKYKDDKLNDAPANISDKTLIQNYGTDEQKALLAAPSTEKGADAATETNTQAATTNDAPANAGNTNDGQPAPAIIDAAHPDYVKALNEYVALNDGQAPQSQMTFEDLIEANTKRAADIKAKALADQEAQKEQAGKQAQEPAKEPAQIESPNLTSSTLNKDIEKVELYNKETKQKRLFSKFAAENYLKNDKAWVAVPQEPQEIQNL